MSWSRPLGLMLVLIFVSGSSPAAAASTANTLPDPVPCPGCWEPAPVTSWQWQLSGVVDTSFDVDMYDIDGFENPASLVESLQGAGRRVVCYLSAGSVERWRPDADRFASRLVGRRLDGWAGERWLDVRRRSALRPIMQRRVDMCAAKGFDGIEFDNVDGWANRTGFRIKRVDQLRYNVMLANMAHRSGLAVLLKNDLEQVPRLLPYFEGALDEECFSYGECDLLQPFSDAGKPVFQVEYDVAVEDFCPEAILMGFNSLRKKWSLGVWRVACA